MSKHWVKWNCDATGEDVIGDVLEVVNDIIRKHNLKLKWEYQDNDNWDYQANIEEEEKK
jgi:hypothetical protein